MRGGEGKEAQRRRQAVLDTALAIGSKHGEEAVTMRAIAAALGINIADLYRHFESKAELLGTLRVQGWRLLMQRLAAVYDAKTEPKALLRGVAHAYLEFGTQHPWLYALQFPTDISDHAEATISLQQELDEARRESAKAFLDTLAHALPTDPFELRLFLARCWTGLHGLTTLVINGRLRSHPSTATADWDRFIDRMVHDLVESLPWRET